MNRVVFFALATIAANARPNNLDATVTETPLVITKITSDPPHFVALCKEFWLECVTSDNQSIVWWNDGEANLTAAQTQRLLVKLPCSGNDEEVEYNYTCHASRAHYPNSAVSSVLPLRGIALPQPVNFNAILHGPNTVCATWVRPFIRKEVPYEYKLGMYFDTDDNMGSDVITYLSRNEADIGDGNCNYRIGNLTDDIVYTFEIAICLSRVQCGEYSESANVFIKSHGSPVNVTAVCRYDNISMSSLLDIIWDKPKSMYTEKILYKVAINERAEYLDSSGSVQIDLDQRSETTTERSIKKVAEFHTNYSVAVTACNVDSELTCGKPSLPVWCITPPGTPKSLPPFHLQAVKDSEFGELKLIMHRVTERYGPITCYRIVLYKMRENQDNPPDVNTINITTYENVNREGNYGAYIAESFASGDFEKEVILGDEIQTACCVSNGDKDCRRSPLIMNNGSYDETSIDLNETDIPVFDGRLSPNTRYSGFVEIIVTGHSGKELSLRSDLFVPVMTVTYLGLSHATALGIITGLLAVVAILAIALCVLRRRSSSGRLEAPTLAQPDIKPIKKEQLVAEFVSRHKDSDFLFQREYEMLPEYFKDRTTKASDIVENFYKNRYPDIKSYDQTRVKLNGDSDSTPNADYINANFVEGYKSQKIFICAQGPLDKTVDDFWRMIWEEKVELIAMVTGLQENGKAKCARYWPEEGEVSYGNLTVSVSKCTVYGEYAVRALAVSCAGQTRTVLQYHYLVWKDFLAPDHPGGILKYIKRINEASATMKGPILVHCSAGVGRTGTLVAVDSLLFQLKEEGVVDVFQCVSAIRRHRNFMVQSLAQYIFIYRALMEFAQFGNTEVDACNLKSHLLKLEETEEDGKSLLQIEFEKLDQVIEDYKTTDIGTMDVNMNKNRYDHIIPFDKNRVILSPLPSRINSSTYINASLIQGYERSSSFIITQDPLNSTLGEFWRMIHEQSAPLIVMLSEIGDEKSQCQRYWPDVEECYENIQVTLKEEKVSDSANVLTFLVTNTKTSKSHDVTQLQFIGWEAQLPNCKSLLALIREVSQLKDIALVKEPIIVHCSGGGSRSSIFVVLSILFQQLQSENKVDVFQAARNLRTQRKYMLHSLEQYRFCYQALIECVAQMEQPHL